MILTSISGIYLTNKRHISYQQQIIINSDINAKDYSRRSLNFINQIDPNYPSLNVFAMPLKSIKAEYLIAKDSIKKGIELHEKGAADNPYLMYSESRLASIYQKLGLQEKFEFYTRKAYKALPNNALHFVMMTRLLMEQNKIDSVFSNFNSIDYEVKIREPQVWLITLAAIVNDTSLIRKYDGKKMAKEAFQRFAYSDQIYSQNIRLMHDYILYGKDNMELASSLEKEGIKMFENGNKIKGIEKIKNAIDLHPNIRQYYDNYIIANYEIENYKAIDQIAITYIGGFEETSPNILYMMARSTYISNDEERDNACQILKDLNSNNLYSFNISEFDMCF